jgi:hypothetical protein
MTRSLTIRDYPAEVRTVQKRVERVFFIGIVLEDLGCSQGWDPPSPASAGLRRDRLYGTHVTYGHRSRIVSPGVMHVPGG